MVLFDKDGLPSAHPEGEYIPVITPIEETLARRFLHLPFEERHQVVTVEMNLECFVSDLVPLEALGHHIGIARRGTKGRNKIHMGKHSVVNRARFDHPRPTNHCRHAKPALPVRGFFPAKGSAAAIGPGHQLGAVIRCVDHDCIIRDAQVVEFQSNACRLEREGLFHLLDVWQRPALVEVRFQWSI